MTSKLAEQRTGRSGDSLAGAGYEVCSCWSLATLCQVLSWNTCGASKSRSLMCKPHCLSFLDPTFRRAPNPDVLCNCSSILLMFGSFSGFHSSSTAALPVDQVTLCCDLARHWDHRFFSLGLRGLHLHWMPPSHPRFLLWTIYFTYFLTNTVKLSVHWCFFSFESSSGLLTCISSFKAPSAPPSGSRLPGNPPQWPSGGGGSTSELPSYPLGSHSIKQHLHSSFLKAGSLLKVITIPPGKRGAISKCRVSESPSPVLSMTRTIASLNLMHSVQHPP